MTSYVSQAGEGEYKIQFETDNREHYLRVQQAIRDCIDGKDIVKELWDSVLDSVRAAKRGNMALHIGVACGKAYTLWKLGYPEKLQRVEELSVVCFEEGAIDKFLQEFSEV